MTDPLPPLEALAGYRFADPSLALKALTHSSWANEHPGSADYERLEFLGDGAVNLQAALRLARRFPDATPEQLTDMRQRVVETTALGVQGARLGLGALVRLGNAFAGDPAPPVRIVGDVVEAVFGAVLTEAGFAATDPLADAVIQPLVDAVDLARPVKHAINQLQEFTQARYAGALPAYTRQESGPEHAKTFSVSVAVGGEVLAHGEGASDKEARARAAAQALAVLRRRGEIAG